MEKIIISQHNQNQRIDKFLSKYYPSMPKSYLYRLFRKKEIKINNHWVKQDYLLNEDDELKIFISEEDAHIFSKSIERERIAYDLDIIYEDDMILIVNKPVGQIVQDGDSKSLTAQVIQYLIDQGDYDDDLSRLFTPAAIHRLDQNTSGLVIFGKNLQSLRALNQMMQEDMIEKFYQCVVKEGIDYQGHLKDKVCYHEHLNQGYICQNGQIMETMYHLLKVRSPYSLLEVQLITGRKHQIRIHLASIGYPIIGDYKYGYQGKIKSQLLHASKVVFEDTVEPLHYLKGQRWNSEPPFIKMF